MDNGEKNTPEDMENGTVAISQETSPVFKRRHRVMDFLARLVKEKPLGVVGAVIVLLLLFTGIFAEKLKSALDQKDTKEKK